MMSINQRLAEELNVQSSQVDAVVGASLDAGITFIDTADIYGG